MISKLRTLIQAIKGKCVKFWLRIIKKRIISNCRLCLNHNNEEIVVSLTSYGRRVSNTLPYTILSLLRQTIKPNRILVWLDKTWNGDNIPRELEELQQCGIEIKFCEDLKSYKKLLPVLKEVDNDIIITCDDDLYYSKNMIERLVEAHHDHPNTVCCQLAHGIRMQNNEIKPYNQWEEEINDVNGCLVFPLGGSGCLYKKEFLYKDVIDYDLANNLAPKADDVWFYFMSLLNKTDHYVLPYKRNALIPLDIFYQYFHSGSSLMEENLSLNLNDKQIAAVMDYYSIKFSDYC